MSIFDTYDKIIENIQQLPLDVYLFVKRSKKLYKKVNKLSSKFRRINKEIIKNNDFNREELDLTYRKLKKYRKLFNRSFSDMKNIIHPIYMKNKITAQNELPGMIIPKINIDNVNRIARIGKMNMNSHSYCTCKQKAYDNMIACDNIVCKIKWFHFECVGITHPPKNIWYCPECRKNR